MEDLKRLRAIYKKSKDTGLMITEWEEAKAIIKKSHPEWVGNTLYDLWEIIDSMREKEEKKGLEKWI